MKLNQAIGLFALIASFFILWQIRQLVLLVFAAVVLATALNQLVEKLQKWNFSRTQAVFTSTLGLLAIFSVLSLLIIPPFIEQFQKLLELLPNSLRLIQGFLDQLEAQFADVAFINIPDIATLISQLQNFITQFLERTIDLFSASVTIFLQIILVIFLTLVFLANPRPYRLLFVRIFPVFYRKRVQEILSLCQVSLGGLTIGLMINMCFIGVISGIGLVILQVPLALAHGILAGVFNLIPNIGPTLSVVSPIAVTLLDEPWKAVPILILYLVVQQIESYWLTPTVMAKQVSLLPAVTLTAQLVFASLFGILGLIIALPLTVVFKTWMEEVLFKDIFDQWG